MARITSRSTGNSSMVKVMAHQSRRTASRTISWSARSSSPMNFMARQSWRTAARTRSRSSSSSGEAWARALQSSLTASSITSLSDLMCSFTSLSTYMLTGAHPPSSTTATRTSRSALSRGDAYRSECQSDRMAVNTISGLSCSSGEALWSLVPSSCTMKRTKTWSLQRLSGTKSSARMSWSTALMQIWRFALRAGSTNSSARQFLSTAGRTTSMSARTSLGASLSAMP
mmetsp:Transcript_3208/g.9397  ORF Transcript_3208/g.9397 Transcript_3208/m.9397 type:complete len:228 (+) Transcript_3208:1829-2512(+)